MNKIEGPQQTVEMYQASENDHDMKDLMTAADYVVLLWIPSFGDLCKVRITPRSPLELAHLPSQRR